MLLLSISFKELLTSSANSLLSKPPLDHRDARGLEPHSQPSTATPNCYLPKNFLLPFRYPFTRKRSAKVTAFFKPAKSFFKTLFLNPFHTPKTRCLTLPVRTFLPPIQPHNNLSFIPFSITSFSIGLQR